MPTWYKIDEKREVNLDNVQQIVLEKETTRILLEMIGRTIIIPFKTEKARQAAKKEILSLSGPTMNHPTVTVSSGDNPLTEVKPAEEPTTTKKAPAKKKGSTRKKPGGNSK